MRLLKTVILMIFIGEVVRGAILDVEKPDANIERRLVEICPILELGLVSGNTAPSFLDLKLLLKDQDEKVSEAVLGYQVGVNCNQKEPGNAVFDIYFRVNNIDVNFKLDILTGWKDDNLTSLFSCFVFISDFGDNDFSSARCLEIDGDGPEAYDTFRDNIRSDLTGMIKYTVQEIGERVTLESVKNGFLKFIEKYEIGKHNEKIKQFLQICGESPKNEAVSSKFKFVNANHRANKISGDQETNFHINTICGSFYASAEVRIFYVDQNYIRIKLESVENQIELDIRIYDQERQDKRTEKCKQDTQDERQKCFNDIFSEEFDQKFDPEISWFLEGLYTQIISKDGTVSDSFGPESASVAYFAGLLDDIILNRITQNDFPAPEGEAQNTIRHKITSLSYTKLLTRKAVKPVDDADSNNQNEESNDTFELDYYSKITPYDYFGTFSESKEGENQAVDFGKFFGKVYLTNMHLDTNTLACRSSAAMTCADIDATTMDKRSDKEVVKNTIAQQQLFGYLHDLEHQPSFSSNLGRYSGVDLSTNPIIRPYLIEDIYRMFLVKIWNFQLSFFSGVLMEFKTQFFSLEYIIPLQNVNDMTTILINLCENMIGHYTSMAYHTHDPTSKPEKFTLAEVVKTVNTAKVELAQIDGHFCVQDENFEGITEGKTLVIYFGLEKNEKSQEGIVKCSDDKSLRKPFLRIKNLKSEFELHFMMQPNDPNKGISISTKYRLKKSYPYSYHGILSNYIKSMISMIFQGEVHKYDTDHKALKSKLALIDGAGHNRILVDKNSQQKVLKHRYQLKI